MWLLLSLVASIVCIYLLVSLETYWEMLWTTSVFLLYVMIVYLLRPTHLNGYDVIEALRRLSVWRLVSPVKVDVVGPKDAYNDLNPDERYIFILLPNYTNTALIWAFGLHGNAWFKGNRLCFLLPAIFFNIPGVREILCFIGAVSDRHNIESTVIEMTRLGKNVAFAPNGMGDALYADDDSCYHAGRPPTKIFKVAVERGYHVVPVLCTGENDRRFLFITSDRIKQLQAWFLSKIGYPFPLIFFPDLRNQFSDRRIHVQVGLPLVADTTLAPDVAAEVLQRDFIKSLQTLNNTGVDKLIIFKE